MLYREAGQFKTSYAADQAVFPIRQDRWLVAAALIAAYIAVPLFASEYWLLTIMIPFLVFALAALGLNLLTGYAGQVSLGTGGFMAVGAFATYKLAVAFPWLNIVLVFLLAGIITALVGLVFGFPSLRIKGFYLAVATLASQFFLIWMFNKFPWFNNYSPSGVISAPPRAVFGHFFVTGAEADPVHKYLFVLSFVALLAFAAKNLVRGRVVGLHLYGRRRALGLRHRPLVPDPLHDHHRRAGQHPGLVPRRRLHRAAADLPRQSAAQLRPRDPRQHRW